MATNTYVALRTETVATATSSVTLSLSGISGYTDLVLVINATASGGALNPQIQFNGDTASNYSLTWMYGNGSAPFSGRYSDQTSSYIGYLTTSQPATFIVQIQNYSNSTTNKTALFRWNTTNTEVGAGVCLWRNTAAITSVTIKTSANNFAVGSTFSLYGVKAELTTQASPKASGGYVYEDSSYWYHVFAFSSTFTPNQSLSADVLCVAGGGGGGTANRGGGGGAGGVIYFAGQSLTATGYTCNIGAGGAGFTQGVNSQFASLTVASGGGRGGASNFGGAYLATAGGSGGGNGNDGTNNGGASNQSSSGATAIYGNRGGNVTVGGDVAGGGGAGAAGTDGVNTNNGIAGGIGTNAFSSWLSATGMGQGGGYIAAGGNGGANYSGGGSLLTTRPLGGGGANSSDSQTINGIANTGSGGSGFSYNSGSGTYPAGSGGSGLVIVRYAK